MKNTTEDHATQPTNATAEGHTLPRDEHGHITLEDAKTDPYGSLEFAVGTGDDFHCFDYAIFQHGGKTLVVLHSVLNSETGGFIQDAEYAVLDLGDDWEGETLAAAFAMVERALDWLAEGGDPLRHDRRGWNQDPFYFVRSLARAIYRHGLEAESIAPYIRDARAFRYGGAKLNRAIERISPLLRGKLPISRRPAREGGAQ